MMKKIMINFIFLRKNYNFNGAKGSLINPSHVQDCFWLMKIKDFNKKCLKNCIFSG